MHFSISCLEIKIRTNKQTNKQTDKSLRFNFIDERWKLIEFLEFGNINEWHIVNNISQVITEKLIC